MASPAVGGAPIVALALSTVPKQKIRETLGMLAQVKATPWRSFWQCRLEPIRAFRPDQFASDLSPPRFSVTVIGVASTDDRSARHTSEVNREFGIRIGVVIGHHRTPGDAA